MNEPGMIELEQKYRVDDVNRLVTRLRELDANEVCDLEEHADTYYNHPSRDFADTKEAFRVRRINGDAWMTYKGSKLPGVMKARREIELRIGQSDQDGQDFEAALEFLSFRRVATVRKQRRTFKLPCQNGSDITIALDKAEQLGDFAELEIVIDGDAEIDAARDEILELAYRLCLDQVEPRSYLTMLLEKLATDQP